MSKTAIRIDGGYLLTKLRAVRPDIDVTNPDEAVRPTGDTAATWRRCGMMAPERLLRLTSGSIRMLHTYRAILDEDRVRWLEQPPKLSGTVQVHITILEENERESSTDRGQVMAESLAKLAQRGTFAEIADPVAWQREVRSERTLPDREP